MVYRAPPNFSCCLTLPRLASCVQVLNDWTSDTEVLKKFVTTLFPSTVCKKIEIVIQVDASMPVLGRDAYERVGQLSLY
jgi:hypothetical protein